MALTAQLAAYSAASLPAGSAERVAAMVAFCHGTFTKLQLASDPQAAGSVEGTKLRIMAHQALLYTLGALGSLHEVPIHLDLAKTHLVVVLVQLFAARLSQVHAEALLPPCPLMGLRLAQCCTCGTCVGAGRSMCSHAADEPHDCSDLAGSTGHPHRLCRADWEAYRWTLGLAA